MNFFGRFVFFLFRMYFRTQKSLDCIFESTLFLSSLFFGFSLKFLDLIMKKTMVFIYISSNRIQHEFFIYFFCCPVIETSKTVIFFDISKMSFCLNRTDNNVFRKRIKSWKRGYRLIPIFRLKILKYESPIEISIFNTWTSLGDSYFSFLYVF